MWWIIGIFVYFLPTFIGVKKEGFIFIFLFNLFAGVTCIGWLLVFLWAYFADESDTFRGMKLKCKKCGQHYELPNESWFGREFICAQCDKYIRVPTPLLYLIDVNIIIWFIVFVILFGATVYHFSLR